MNHNLHTIFRLIVISVFWHLGSTGLIAQSAVSQENYDVKHYFISVDVSDTTTFISASASIAVELLAHSDSLYLDFGDQLVISALQVNGNSADYIHGSDKLIILYSFNPGTLTELFIEYSGDGDAVSAYGAVFNRSLPPFGNFTYTLTEPYSTKHWYPCKEVLSDKADSVFVYVTVDSNLKAGSNGLLTEVRDLGNGKHQYKWESRYPAAFYLVSFAVGNYYDYTIYSEGNNSFPIINYLYNSPEYIEAEKQNIDTTIHLLNLFSELYGEYPFSEEKYGHCIVPLGGGMEHQTMSTMGNFGFNLVAHELAHQWFGNYVTCSSWNHIWINEGFASYSEYLAHEFSGDPEGANSWIQYAQQAAINTSRGSVYVPEDELGDASRIFHFSTTYKKGAAIIHMLRYEIGDDEKFFNILSSFLSRFQFSVASAGDLQRAVEDETGRSFDYFFEQWYYGEGHPEFTVDWYQNNDTLVIISNQSASVPEKTAFFNMKTPFKLNFPSGDSTLNLLQDSPHSIHKIFIKEPVINISLDPQNILLKQVNSINRVDSLSGMILPDVFIYPNPAEDSIRIYSNSIRDPISLSFYSMSGSRVKVISNVSPLGTDISISDLATGVYLISVNFGTNQSILKLVKS